MRAHGRIVVFLAMIPVLSAGSSLAQTQLKGQWEGFVSTSRRPTLILIEFEGDGAALQGTITLQSTQRLVLETVRLNGPQIHFEVPLETGRVAFDGKLEDGRIDGRAIQGGNAVSFWLRPLPLHPPPKNRVEAWQQDLDALEWRFLEYDRSFTPETKAQAQQQITRLRAALSSISDPEVIVSISRIVALAGNAHTRLYLLRHRTELRRYPIRVDWFPEGLYVVKAAPEHRELVSCRVVRIGNQKPDKVRAEVSRLFTGNESWTQYMSTYFITSPEILSGLHLIRDMEGADWRFECAQGRRFLRVLKPLPLHKKDQTTEAWKDLTPLAREDGQEWVHALGSDPGALPLYLRHPDRNYWFEYLEDSRLLYFQYNRSQNQSNGEPFKEFSATILQTLAQGLVRTLVIDLRFNTGGDNSIAREFLRSLANRPEINQKGRLFVITGHATFSAGLTHAAELKQFTQATFVGEPVGDRLDYWSEGANLSLPNSKLTVRYANGFHKYSTKDYPELKPYFQELSISGLAPDIPIQLSWRDYRVGRDPALEAILSYKK